MIVIIKNLVMTPLRDVGRAVVLVLAMAGLKSVMDGARRVYRWFSRDAEWAQSSDKSLRRAQQTLQHADHRHADCVDNGVQDADQSVLRAQRPSRCTHCRSELHTSKGLISSSYSELQAKWIQVHTRQLTSHRA